ncbi:hypothetical protein EI94DRAFT_1633661, partial [Lactarius quietus]
QFLFKAIHNTPMVGEVWFRIQNFEQCRVCRACDTTELMEHIFIGCTQTTMNLIWRLASELWDHECYRWPPISIGIVLGCGNLSARPHINDVDKRTEQQRQTNVKSKGVTRLLQILISEATHLIWVLRCERVIQEKIHAASEAKARWFKAINRRLMEDKIIATKIKHDDQYTKLIVATWEDPLTKFSDLPPDWIQNREVLVGRRAHRALPI